MPVIISALYKFVTIEDPAALRAELLADMQQRQMRGTLLIAHEGINGTISGPEHQMTAFLQRLRADPRFADIDVKEARAATHPFRRLKVKVKREIITLRMPEADPSVSVGTYVAPEAWNALISRPDVLVLDTRNVYEIEAGTFMRAIDPGTRTFGEFPRYVAEHLDPARDRAIAMFCTGGIRCEKASAYLKNLGFAEVYHLKGGVLNYLSKVPAEDSLWRGRCFVFDEREAVGADGEPGQLELKPQENSRPEDNAA